MTKYARVNFVKSLLEKQNYKCVFGKNVGHIYCTSELQWGYTKSISGKEEQSVDNLYLLCTICKSVLFFGQKIVLFFAYSCKPKKLNPLGQQK